MPCIVLQTEPRKESSRSAPLTVAVVDFNGDGRPDVEATNADSNTVSVLLNDGDWDDLPPPPPPLLPLPPRLREAAFFFAMTITSRVET